MSARVDPAVVAITRLLLDRGLVPYPVVVGLLQDIDHDYPTLRFADFVTAIRLAYLADKPQGSA